MCFFLDKEFDTIIHHLKHMFDGFKKADLSRSREERNRTLAKGVKACAIKQNRNRKDRYRGNKH